MTGGCNKDGSTCDSPPSRVPAGGTSESDGSCGDAAGEEAAAAAAAEGCTDERRGLGRFQSFVMVRRSSMACLRSTLKRL